jgi:hypothetical protein
MTLKICITFRALEVLWNSLINIIKCYLKSFAFGVQRMEKGHQDFFNIVTKNIIYTR